MAATIAANRLRKELSNLKKDPPPGIIAEPKESDILTWFFALQGPEDTPYEGGVYVGKLKFPPEYPMKPPSILMLTPSGRFQVNTRICMSMSDFHPESWNPMWSISTILTGVVSFMTSEELTTGGLKAPDSERKQLAGESKAYNDEHFRNLFDGDMESAFANAEEARKVSEKAAIQAASSMQKLSLDNRRKGAAAECEKEEDKETTTELSLEETERRRKKNAKKRAKQKAKKQNAADTEDQDLDA